MENYDNLVLDIESEVVGLSEAFERFRGTPDLTNIAMSVVDVLMSQGEGLTTFGCSSMEREGRYILYLSDGLKEYQFRISTVDNHLRVEWI